MAASSIRDGLWSLPKRSLTLNQTQAPAHLTIIMRNKLLIVFLAVLGLFSPPVLGRTFTQGNFSFQTLPGQGNRVSISVPTPANVTGDVTIPATVTDSDTTYAVTEIAAKGFFKVKANAITVPPSIVKMGSMAFQSASCKKVVISDVKAWCGIQFVNNISNPLYWASHIYLGDNEITDLTVPEGLTSIGDYAFIWASALNSVKLPESLQEIGDNAFSYCTSLTSVKIPDAVKKIGVSAFQGCSKIAGTLTVPAGVQKIGNYAFDGLAITGVNLPENASDWGKGVFQNCTKLKYARIPDSMKETPHSLFWKCTSLDSVTWGANTVGTAQASFNKCGFRRAIVPEGVKYLGNYAFYWNDNLEYIDLPSTLDSLGTCAFSIIPSNKPEQANKIKTVICRNPVPPATGSSMGSAVFDDKTFAEAALLVPAGAMQAYRDNAFWGQFTSISEMAAPDSVTLTLNWTLNNVTGNTEKRCIDTNNHIVLYDYDNTFYNQTSLQTPAANQTITTKTFKVPRGKKYDVIVRLSTSTLMAGGMQKALVREGVVINRDTVIALDANEATRHIGMRYILPDGSEAKVKTQPKAAASSTVWTGANIFRSYMEAGLISERCDKYASYGIYNTNANLPYLPKGNGYDQLRATDLYITPGLSDNFKYVVCGYMSPLDTVKHVASAIEPTLLISRLLSVNADSVYTTLPGYKAFTPVQPKASLYTPQPTEANRKWLFRIYFLQKNYRPHSFVVVGSWPQPEGKMFTSIDPDAPKMILNLGSFECSKVKPGCAESGSGIMLPEIVAGDNDNTRFLVNNYLGQGFTPNEADEISAYQPHLPGHPVFSYNLSDLDCQPGNTAPFAGLEFLPALAAESHKSYTPTNSTNVEWVGMASERRTVDMQSPKHAFRVIANGDTIITSWARMTSLMRSYTASDHQPGKVRFEFDNNSFTVDSLQGHSIARFEYDEKIGDITPPTITMLQTRNAGKVTNKCPNFVDAKLYISGGDFNIAPPSMQFTYARPQSFTVQIAPHGTENWQTINGQEVPDAFFEHVWGTCWEFPLIQYSSNLKKTWYDLRITMTDAAGNTMEQKIGPAVYSDKATNGVDDVTEGRDFISCCNGIVTLAEEAYAEVFSADGRIVLAQKATQIDLNALGTGIYIVRAGNASLKVLVR